MTRIAVLGANGQVGAELCLILQRQPGIELVPVCRNRLGSAYLRSVGIACRHGQPSNWEETEALFGDCDIVANLSLVPTLRNPTNARQVNRAILEHVARRLGRRGKHIYFSTMSIYGDQEVGDLIRFANLYGAEKKRSERIAVRAGRAAGCSTYVFRLGNVCGDLQGISKAIRAEVSSGIVRVPDLDRPSNSTHVVTIVDAILQVAQGGIPEGVYDLMNVPQWTWREVFDFEASRMRVKIEYQHAPDRQRLLPAALKSGVTSVLGAALRSESVRRIGGRLVGHVPYGVYRRLKARYAVIRAGADISSLHAQGHVIDAVYRKPIVPRSAPHLRTTRELLDDHQFVLANDPGRTPWPPDLPAAAG